MTIHSETQAILEHGPSRCSRVRLLRREAWCSRGQVHGRIRTGLVMTEMPPYVSRVLVSFTGDPQASPAGWVEANETAGNNVIAGKNPLAEFFLPDPVTAKSATRDFQFPLQFGIDAPNPTNFVEAATVNLFYWMNRAHDLFWHVGFNEAAGNYQKRNFGRGGIEGDPIYTYAQFGIQQILGAP